MKRFFIALLMALGTGFISFNSSLYAQINSSRVYRGRYKTLKSTKPRKPFHKIHRYFITDKLLARPSYQHIRGRMQKARAAFNRRKISAVKTGPKPGSHRQFYTRNVENMNDFYRVKAKCIYVSSQLVIWIDEKDVSQLPASLPVSSIIKQLSNFLEENTPPASVNSKAGIIPIEQSYFGQPPVSGGGSRLNILLLNIRDRFRQTGSYVAGFFDPVNLTSDPHSNHLDMIYVDLYPALYYEGELHTKRVASTIAHEYQHLIHANYEGKNPQYIFINEGLSTLAALVCGFSPRPGGPYFTHPNRPLLSWNAAAPLPDYSRASLFLEYLFEQIGDRHIKTLEQTTKRGLKALQYIVRKYSSITFKQLFLNWGKALLINNRGIDPAYGYKDPRRKNIRFPALHTYNYLPASGTYHLRDLVHIPLLFPLTKTLRFQTSRPRDSIRISADAVSFQNAQRLIIPEGSSTISAAGEQFPSIRLLVSNTHSQESETDTSTTKYNFLARGEKSGVTITRAYDDGTADKFTKTASYLLLNGKQHEKFAVVFAPKQTAWLYGVAVNGIFLNELQGTELPGDAERDIKIRIYKWKKGSPGRPLTPPIIHSFVRPLGDLEFEQISLLNQYKNLSALRDSFCVVIQNDADDANYFAVGMDNSHQGHTWFTNSSSNQWQPMRRYSIAGKKLKGWNAMIRADEVVQQKKIPVIIRPKFSVNFNAVTVRFNPDFAVDTAQTACFARLPSGSIVQGERKAVIGSPYLAFSFPVQTNGKYHFYARIISADGGRASHPHFSWKIPTSKEFHLGYNYPNPFTTRTTLPFMLLKKGIVQAAVYNILGQRVEQMRPKRFPAGRSKLQVQLTGAASGVYLVRLHYRQANSAVNIYKTEKIMHIR